MRDPYPVLRTLLDDERAALPTVLNGFRMWVVTRHADSRRVLSDRTFEKDIASHIREVAAHSMVRPDRAAKLPRAIRRGVLDRDGADHRRLRDLLSDDFRPPSVERLRARVEQLSDALLGDLPARAVADIVGQLARPLATAVVSELLGVPAEDRHEFPDWENAIFTGTSPEEVEQGGRSILALCGRLIELKRAEPGDDLLTRLVVAHDQGKLDDDELASTVANVLIGGMEASTPIGSGVALLLSHRDQLARVLEDPTMLPPCVEEILRYESPFRIFAPRFSGEPLELEGVTIPRGELIAVCPAAANRDPRHYPDPDAFEIDRRTLGHLAFGHGPHHCIGIHLARLEASIALQRFLERFPDSRLAVRWEDLSWRPGAFMRRLDSLPVVLG